MIGFQARSILDNYKDAVQRFRDAQMGCKENMRAKLKRQVTNVDPDITPREAESLINDPKALKQIMEQKLVGKTHMKVYNAVNDIKDKYNDILVLEEVPRAHQNVSKIMDLLKEINMLINESGQIIDEIERKQKEAKLRTEKGVKNLTEAKEHSEEAKKVAASFTRNSGRCVSVL